MLLFKAGAAQRAREPAIAHCSLRIHMKHPDASCCERNVFDISISLNGVFVFELSIGYDLVLCLKILREGSSYFGNFENQNSSAVKPQQRRPVVQQLVSRGAEMHHFTYHSAPLTDVIRKTNPLRWTNKEEACFQDSKTKISSTTCLGVPRPKGEMILITDACDVGAGVTLYQCQEVNPAELSHCQLHTSGLNGNGTLKHDYPANQWCLVPLGHWKWKWNQARSN